MKKKNISNLLKYFLRLINYSVVCFQGWDSLKQIIILLNGKIMHVIEWVTKTVNLDGKNLRHLKSQKMNLFQSFLYFWAFNLVFICPTLCHMKTTCLLLMKKILYALDAFFIEKLKLSEIDPFIRVKICLVHVHVTNFCSMYLVYTVTDPPPPSSFFFFGCLFYSKLLGAIIIPKYSPGLILDSAF